MCPVHNMGSYEEDNTDSSGYHYKKDFRTVLPQFLAVSAKNLLLLGYGMTLGFSTILMPAVQKPQDGEILHLNKEEISWISSINLIVVPVGCALSGLVTTPLGRKKAMQIVNIPFCIAWLLFHFSTTTAHLYAALFLTGIAGGLLEAPVLTYVSEITQPHVRGALAATSSLSIIIGVFTQFLLGLLLYWRVVALVNIVFSVLAIIALFFVPESPYWLVSRRRFSDAKKSLQWLRGWTNASAVEKEFLDIQSLFTKEKVADAKDIIDETFIEKASHYLKRSFIVPFFLVSFSFFIGHFSGMTTLQTYAVSIFQMLKTPIDKYYATLLLGVLQIIGTATCVILVHYTGKRPLTLISTAGTSICCILVAAFDLYIKMYGVESTVEETSTPISTNNTSTSEPNEVHNPYSWMPMTLLLLLALISHTGLRMLPWILIGEVFSAKTRAGGAGFASAFGYIFGFLTNKIYINMVDTFSICGTYGLYGFVGFFGCFVFYFILPETEGKTLNDIENHFAGRKQLTNQLPKSKAKLNGSKMTELKGATNPTFEGDTKV